jgi:hypothetical protein
VGELVIRFGTYNGTVGCTIACTAWELAWEYLFVKTCMGVLVAKQGTVACETQLRRKINLVAHLIRVRMRQRCEFACVSEPASSQCVRAMGVRMRQRCVMTSAIPCALMRCALRTFGARCQYPICDIRSGALGVLVLTFSNANNKLFFIMNSTMVDRTLSAACKQ